MTLTRTSFEFITVETGPPEVGLDRIVLRRPPLNILHVDMIAELNAALAGLRRQPPRVLVLAAQGKAFCAGVSVEDHLPHRVRPMLKAFHDLFRNLRALGSATVAAVQGAALGGGCELACFADLVIASEDASFGQPEIKLGVFPPVAAVHLPRRIGTARTLQLVLSGDILPAQQAERIGLVDRVVPSHELEGVVQAAALRWSEKSAPALVAALVAEESLRVKNRIGERLAERRWAVPAELVDACSKALPPGFALDGGHIVAR